MRVSKWLADVQTCTDYEDVGRCGSKEADVVKACRACSSSLRRRGSKILSRIERANCRIPATELIWRDLPNWAGATWRAYSSSHVCICGRDDRIWSFVVQEAWLVHNVGPKEVVSASRVGRRTNKVVSSASCIYVYQGSCIASSSLVADVCKLNNAVSGTLILGIAIRTRVGRLAKAAAKRL